jgi:hypothetical protein
MTDDMTKKGIEKALIMYKRFESLYYKKIMAHMNVFPQFVYEPLELKDFKENEESDTSYQSFIGSQKF